MKTPSITHRDTGSMAWAIMVVIVALMLTASFVSHALMQAKKSQAAVDSQLSTQRLTSGVADALALLNHGTTLAATHDTAGTTCQQLDGRSVCNLTWATPVPGQATSPMRYDLLLHTWVDKNHDVKVSPNENVHANLVPLQAITYQNRGVVKPTIQDGYVAYPTTPLSLFTDAIHAFSSVTLAGPTLEVLSYNSVAGTSGTGTGVVSSDGTVSYGSDTKADQTTLYGGASAAGDFTERCTGEACAESDVQVMKDTHTKPTTGSEAWMQDPSLACNQTFTGDWRSSQHSGMLPGGVTCVNGNLVIDVPTTRATASATVYVYGNVIITDDLNVSHDIAKPGALQIYTTGSQVAFAPTDTAGTGIAALIYAPFATCGTAPTGNAPITYYGSLVCDTVSLAGPWSHRYDEAQTIGLTDPVPGAAVTWTQAPSQIVEVGSHYEPEGWGTSTCVVPAPDNAVAFWKFDEIAGLTAHDSSGNKRDAVYGSAGSRITGVCAQAIPMTSTGTASYNTSLAPSTTGVSVSWWGKDAVGTVFQGAGVTVNQTVDGHVQVVVGGVTKQVPFTVQQKNMWHRYVLTIDTSGLTRLFVDGLYKDATTIAVPSAAGAVTLAAGSQGTVDELAYLARVVPASEVASDWAMWNQTVVYTPSSAGLAFSAPVGVSDNGTTSTSLKVAWQGANGTLSGAGTADAIYRVMYSTTSTGAYTTLGDVAKTATTYTQANPPLGMNFYKVCTIYNGDTKCSAPVRILTLVAPSRAPYLTVSNITNATADFNWTAVAGATGYESQLRLNGGVWYGVSYTSVDGYSVTNHGTNLGVRQGPTVQGTNLEMRVRAVNSAGPGPWTPVVQGVLAVDSPVWPSAWDTPYMTTNMYENMGARLMSASAMCPSGTVPQLQYRDQGTNWGGSWNGWGTWTSGTAGSNYAPWAWSNVQSFAVGARQQHNLRCYNPTSGQGSYVLNNGGSLWTSMDLYHPLPAPTGTWAGIVAYRTAGWGTTCAYGLTPSFQWQVVTTTFNTGPQGWTFGTSWANTGQAWGSGTVWVTARCETGSDIGGRYSPTESNNGGF